METKEYKKVCKDCHTPVEKKRNWSVTITVLLFELLLSLAALLLLGLFGLPIIVGILVFHGNRSARCKTCKRMSLIPAKSPQGKKILNELKE